MPYKSEIMSCFKKYVNVNENQLIEINILRIRLGPIKREFVMKKELFYHT